MPAERVIVVGRHDEVQKVPLSTGDLFPEEVDVYVFERDRGLQVKLRLGVQDGRPVLLGISVDRQSAGPDAGYLRDTITASDVHQLPLDEEIVSAVRAVAMVVADADSAHATDDGAAAGVRAVHARRRRAITDALLAQVSQIVTANPDAPTRAVAEQMPTSYRTAGRWIAEARARGVLERKKEKR